MTQHNYSRYFRVFRNDTTVTEISTNDFRPSQLKSVHQGQVTFSLPDDGQFFYGYLTREKAMEMAKAGALQYMETLIEMGKSGMAALLKYRSDHYEDLNENLTYANIEAIKNQNTLS